MGDYDFNKALDASLEDTRKRQDDLLLQRGELESQFADVSRDTPEEKKGGWASMLLPALIGAAIGKNRNQRFGLGLTGAGTAGTEYWNNLEADEKEKKAMIVDKLKMNQSLYQDERNQFQQLTGKGLDFQSGMQQAWEKGAIPSTDPTSPYAQNMLAEQNQSIAVNNASSANALSNSLALSAAEGKIPLQIDPRTREPIVDPVTGNPAINPAFTMKESADPMKVNPAFIEAQVQEAMRRGYSPATVDSIRNAGSNDLAYKLLDAGRRQANQEMEKTGEKPKTLPTEAYKLHSDYKSGLVASDRVEQKIKEWETRTDLPKDKYGKLIWTEALKRLPATETDMLFQELKRSAMGLGAAEQGGRGLTDADVKLYIDYLASPSALANGQIQSRIGVMKEKAKTGVVSYAKALRTQGAYRKNADAFLKDLGLDSLDSEASTDKAKTFGDDGVGVGAPGSGDPVVGGMFNGQRIKSVTRID